MTDTTVVTDSWHSYPSVYALGHRALVDLFADDVIVEEKIDGSQFSFGVFDGVLRCRSKGQQIILDGPVEGMFKAAVATAIDLAPLLRDGWTYRAEYLQKPAHNALAYGRVPERHLIVFDINTDLEAYLTYEEKAAEAARIGLEVVPLIGAGRYTEPSEIYAMLARESVLGGQMVEGVVIKNYARFGLDKKVLIGKYVSEAFKEVHAKTWRIANPRKADIVDQIIERYATEARWQKAVQHLRDDGRLQSAPQDIGPLMVEVQADVEKECREEIAAVLYSWAWPQIKRRLSGGLPEWYKQQLLTSQFEEEQVAS